MKRALLVIAMLAAGCNKGPSEGQCKQLMEHLVDLEMARAGAAGAGSNAPTEGMKEANAKQKAAVIEQKGGEFVTMCSDKIAKSRIDCALAAKDLDAVAKCDGQ